MKKASVTLAYDFRTGKTSPALFSSFVEHLGRSVYGGLYEPDHPTADDDGFRGDVISLVKELGVSYVRYPGGNFVSGYNWEDGVGPRSVRPKRLELAWGSTETNEFGTDEFVKWCRKAGAEPMMAVNLGTKGPEDARRLVEYCNHPGGTELSDLRIKNGSKEPHGIKLWCLGNEMDGNWQMGHKDAEEYAKAALEASKLMKWTDPSIKTVICGSSGWGMSTFGEWEKTALETAWDSVDYISMHQYLGNGENDLKSFLAKTIETDRFIESVEAACRFVKGKKHSDKNIYISFDEWNVWYHSHGAEFEKWSKAPRILEDVYNFADALVVGMMLNSIIRHCDSVKIACLAQLVNVIAPIMTETGGGIVRQTIFWPFYYASHYAVGYRLEQADDSPLHDTDRFSDVPDIDSVSVLSEDGTRLTVFAVNRSLTETIPFEIKLCGFEGFVPTGHIALENTAADAVNTIGSEPVKPACKPLPETNGAKASAALSPLSWNMLSFEKIK